METRDNKYLKWYWNICENAKGRILPVGTYVEKHHIYPKSIYGKNKELVKLTAKEHYIVHLVLWWGLRFKYGNKDTRTNKMAYAFNMMNVKSSSHSNYRYDSKLYAFLKIANNEKLVSLETRRKIGMYHKGKTVSKETKEKMSISKKDIYLGENNPMFGKRHTIKTKLKISEANLGKRRTAKEIEKMGHKGEKHWNYGKHHSNSTIQKLKISPKNIEVCQYDLSGNFIKDYISYAEAAEQNNLHYQSISANCKGKSKSAGGYIWKIK